MLIEERRTRVEDAVAPRRGLRSRLTRDVMTRGADTMAEDGERRGGDSRAASTVARRGAPPLALSHVVASWFGGDAAPLG